MIRSVDPVSWPGCDAPNRSLFAEYSFRVAAYSFKVAVISFFDTNKPLNPMQEHFNELRSRIRSRVEHMFGVIKCAFGFDKLRCRGLAKNANRLFTVCALANLFIVRRKLA